MYVHHAAVGLLALVMAASAPSRAGAEVRNVAPGASIQAAIDAAGHGDVIQLDAGVYVEDIDFVGKDLTVVGAGPETVIRGTGTRSVVRFANGESTDAILDSVTVTGGVAPLGGGIFVGNASPTIVRSVISENHAALRGSGIYVQNGSPVIVNNVISYNGHAGGDPHGIEVVDAAPLILNNTIARGDSNGIILRGASPALVMNNILANNGSRVDGALRGRGICDFSGGSATIHYNVFYRNRVAALLTNGQDFRRIQKADAAIGEPRLRGNASGRPGFVGRVRPNPAKTTTDDFRLRSIARRARALDAGDPDPSFADVDGSRNDAGAGGGPLAPAWLR